MSINPERGNAFLRMRGKNRGKINRAGTFRAVESPDRGRNTVVERHRFGTVAPAGGHGQHGTDILRREEGGTICRFRGSADTGRGDDNFDRQTAGMTYIRRDERGGRLRHVHRLVLERFAHAAVASIDSRTNPYFRKRGTKPVDRRILCHDNEKPFPQKMHGSTKIGMRRSRCKASSARNERNPAFRFLLVVFVFKT